ncbi:Ig-like domain-containing protein [bacterium]|nr:Ig-like domain-containing protein [bacterium]
MGNLTKVIALTILVFGLATFAEPWTTTLTLDDGTRTLELTFGRIDGALDLLGDEDVVLAIPPPSGSYAWFEIDDPINPYITMLYTDIRQDNGDSALWVTHIFSLETSISVEWNSAALPAGDFFIGAHYPTEDVDTWVNMKTIDTLDITPGIILDIVHQPSGYYPEDEPVFSNWYPYDGATGVSVTSDIRFDVTDVGSGIDPSSITMEVHGVEVTDDIALTPIEDGYRVSYEPDLPLPGESWISVIVTASDNAHEPHVADAVIAYHTGYSILPVQWEVPLNVYNIDGEDTQFVDISFGADPLATAGFNMGYDMVFPMAPPSVFYAFFPLTDPDYSLYRMLTRDIRSSDLFFDEWIVYFGNTDDVLGIVWDEADIPTDKNAFIAITFPSIYPTDGEWQDMRDIDFVEFGPGRQAWVKVLSPSGDTLAPRVVYTDPADGETGVAVSSEIHAKILDIGSGVDPTSIWMIVDGVDVTMSLLVSSSSGTTMVRYIPPMDFDPLETIEVTIGVDDLADPANHTEYNWDFVTGYFLTPEWMESLFVWTDEPGELLHHFTLYFGGDTEGTDLFDYGLDQQQPPAPPGDTPYGFFHIDDPLWGQLARDIRDSEDDDIMWVGMMMRIPVDDEIDNWISWNSDYLPEDGSFQCAWWLTGDTVWQNMRLINRIDIETPGVLLIHFNRGVPPTYCLAGTVSTADGGPIGGATIWISEELNTTSDVDGYYQICEIEGGEWGIFTSIEGYYPDSAWFTFADNIEYNPVLLPMPPPLATVSGYITCEDAGSSEDAMVILGSDTTYADTEGYYEFLEIPMGDYTMHVSLEYYIPQTREITVDDIVIEEDFLLLRQIGNIVGVITLSDDPPNLSGTMVELTGTTFDAVYTNSDGEYLISDVPYGDYDIRISRISYITLDTNLAHLSLEDTLNAELEYEFILPPPQELTGRATYDTRIILSWEEPEPSTATLQGYNIYRQIPFSDDSIVGYVPDPYTEFVEWDLINYLPYTYSVTAVYDEGESEPEGPTTVWLNPETTSADILIWDYDNGAMLANQGETDEGEFLRQRVELWGDMEVEVTGQDENLGDRDLFAYRAIILITGVDDATDAIPNNSSINAISRYIAAGGRIYCEGADFGYDFGRDASPPNRKKLFLFFGATYIADGYTHDDGNVMSLLGEDTSFFTEGVVNIGYDYQSNADQRIDEWDTTETAEGVTWAMFSQSDPAPLMSNLRMLYREMHAWRSVLSSVYIGAMNDGPAPSGRQHVIAAILNFLLGTDYILVQESKDILPEKLALSASPNPFNAVCKFSIEVDAPGNLDLSIIDITGRPVARLSEGWAAAGFYSTTWDGTDDSGVTSPSGVYFAVLKCGDKVAKTRVTLVK